MCGWVDASNPIRLYRFSSYATTQNLFSPRNNHDSLAHWPQLTPYRFMKLPQEETFDSRNGFCVTAILHKQILTWKLWVLVTFMKSDPTENYPLTCTLKLQPYFVGANKLTTSHQPIIAFSFGLIIIIPWKKDQIKPDLMNYLEGIQLSNR